MWDWSQNYYLNKDTCLILLDIHVSTFKVKLGMWGNFNVNKSTSYITDCHWFLPISFCVYGLLGNEKSNLKDLLPLFVSHSFTKMTTQIYPNFVIPFMPHNWIFQPDFPVNVLSWVECKRFVLMIDLVRRKKQRILVQVGNVARTCLEVEIIQRNILFLQSYADIMVMIVWL